MDLIESRPPPPSHGGTEINSTSAIHGIDPRNKWTAAHDSRYHQPHRIDHRVHIQHRKMSNQVDRNGGLRVRASHRSSRDGTWASRPSSSDVTWASHPSSSDVTWASRPSSNGETWASQPSNDGGPKPSRPSRPSTSGGTWACRPSNSGVRPASGSSLSTKNSGYRLEERIARGWWMSDSVKDNKQSHQKGFSKGTSRITFGTNFTVPDAMDLDRDSNSSSHYIREEDTYHTPCSDRIRQESTGVSSTGEGSCSLVRNTMITRPISAVHSAVTARRYLDARLKDMYDQRRAVTSLPRARGNIRGVTTFLGSRSRARSLLSNAPEMNVSHMHLAPLSKFRLIGRITICLLRLMKSIILNSQDKTDRSAAELQWFTLYGQSKSTQLAFNKDIYSRNRIMTHIPEWAVSILDLQPEQRTEEHCRLLHALLRGLKSFDKFTEQIQMSMCRAFRLEKVSEGRVVLKQNHIGMYFYFIYSGSVFVNTADETADGTSFSRTIAMLTRGDSFGELALLKDIRRTASVTVREKCELLVVDKDVFARVCPKIFEKELEDKHTFISKLSLFPSKWWTSDKLRALSMQAQIQEFKINKVVVPDSALEDWIYACMEGKCQVIQCLSLKKAARTVEPERKHSDVVLSEEIIELLSSAAAVTKSRKDNSPGENMKENLLSSLGLDYAHSGKGRGPLYETDLNKARLRALQGLDETTTLSALMKKNAETKKHELYLKVDNIEPGDVFDLRSLLKNDNGEYNPQAGSLLLVSGGAKILKIRKSAFFANVSQQAMEHTKILAKKQSCYTDEYLIQSYKQKKLWEKFKSDIVTDVLQTQISKDEHINLMHHRLKPASPSPKYHHTTCSRPTSGKSNRVANGKQRPNVDLCTVSGNEDRKEDRSSTCSSSCSSHSRDGDGEDQRDLTSSPSWPYDAVCESDQGGKILQTEDHKDEELKNVLTSTSDNRQPVKSDILIIRRNSISLRNPKSIKTRFVTSNSDTNRMRRPHTAHPGTKHTRW